MPEVWKNKRSETGKRNANFGHYYMCLPEGATCVCIIIFYIKFIQLLCVLLFYICIRRSAFLVYTTNPMGFLCVFELLSS